MNKTKLAVLLAGVLLSAQAMAYEKGDWIARVGVTHVAPDASSSPILAGGADLGVALGLGSLEVDVDSGTALGINVAYFVTDNINVELLAATPFSHDIEFLGGQKLAETDHLPPSLTVNFFFLDPASKFQPYVGAGLNYTFFFEEEFDQGAVDTIETVTGGAVVSDLDLDASFGLTVQAGFDYEISKDMFFNASVRYIDIETDASFNINGEAGGSIETVDIDPFVYTVSIGYRF